MKFQEGDHVIVNGDIHVIVAVERRFAQTRRVDWDHRFDDVWMGKQEDLAVMQIGHWRQVVKTCRVPGGYYAKGLWCANTKMMPVWEHVVP